MGNRAEIGLCRISPGCLLSDSTAPAGWLATSSSDQGTVGPSDARQAGLYALLGLDGTGRKSDFVLFRLAGLPGTRLPQLAGWPRRSSDQAARDSGEAGASQACDSAGTGRKVDLVTVAAASREASHHRDETEMAFPGRTRLRSPPLEPAGERARPTLALSKGHRAEMELWRNKKALDLRGHRTTPHRSGERRGYRSETESP